MLLSDVLSRCVAAGLDATPQLRHCAPFGETSPYKWSVTRKSALPRGGTYATVSAGGVVVVPAAAATGDTCCSFSLPGEWMRQCSLHDTLHVLPARRHIWLSYAMRVWRAATRRAARVRATNTLSAMLLPLQPACRELLLSAQRSIAAVADAGMLQQQPAPGTLELDVFVATQQEHQL
jgi:hypothetical protein